LNVQLIQQISSSFQVHLHLVIISDIQQFPVYTVLNSHYFTPHLCLHGSTSCVLFIFYNFYSISTEQTQFTLLYVPYILWNAIVFVQQMNNIYKHGNIRQCSKMQTFLIYIVHFLDTNNINQSILQPVHSIQSHVHKSTLTC